MEVVSVYWTELFGGWSSILNIALSLKTFVLISVFIVVFIGVLPWWLFLIVMVLVMVSVSFICATTPMLTPYNTVLIQTIWTGVVCLYGVIVWVVMIS